MNRIRALRQELQAKYPYAFTLEEVARRVRVHPATLRSWEQDRHRPRGPAVERLARDLGVSVEALGLDADDPESPSARLPERP